MCLLVLTFTIKLVVRVDFFIVDRHGDVSLQDDYNHAMSYPVYHSIHDSFHWMTSFVDPDFTHHLTLGRVLAKVAMTFVDQQLLSFNFSRLAWSLSQCQKSLIEKHGQDFAKHHLKLGMAYVCFVSAPYGMHMNSRISSLGLCAHLVAPSEYFVSR